MKKWVYIINGCEGIEWVFSSKKKALKYLKDNGYKPREKTENMFYCKDELDDMTYDLDIQKWRII